MKTIINKQVIGYLAGIITGITYGLNPLFAVPLMQAGASVEAILFFRYTLSVLFLGIYLVATKQFVVPTLRQMGVLVVLGLLFCVSSLCLFGSYNYIASGLATTLVFLFPVFVALIMVLLRVYPTWQVWIAIVMSFVGVLVMTQSSATQTIRIEGVLMALSSALLYATFIVIINRSKAISTLSNSVLTFYALSVGIIVFLIKLWISETPLMVGLEKPTAWLNLVGLAVFPTIISTATLALATRNIGATKASVLGVFEPVTAILVGTLVFGETLTTNIIIGILLSMAAVTFMVLSTKK